MKKSLGLYPAPLKILDVSCTGKKYVDVKIGTLVRTAVHEKNRYLGAYICIGHFSAKVEITKCTYI